MPTPLRAPRLSVEDRRESILDAAVPLFMAHGSDVTTRQIADAAGIAEGTIFRAFADKDALIAAAVQRFMDPAPTLAQLATIDQELDLEQTVTAIATILQQRIVGVMGIMHAVGMRKPPANFPRPEADAGRSVTLAILGRHREELRVEPEEAMTLIRVAVFGSTMTPFAGVETLGPRELARFIVNGIAKDS